ncbi:MAG: glutamate 5-kinase [Coriobacteriales bacterium]|jgi:glutamate 5-kinase|nr:glutamate 5-kinase [Coriobacteriales bacterium]
MSVTTFPHRIVLKIGTSTLTNAQGRIDAAYLVRFATQVAALRQQGCEIVVVTSGAMVAGLEILGLPPERTDQIPLGQAAAAVGQPELIKQYFRAFWPYEIKIAQVLLSSRDLAHSDSRELAQGTFDTLLEMGTIPLVNENDSVAVEEIRFGDNDRLAAAVAILIRADLMIILSDVEGLYDGDPRSAEAVNLISSVSVIDQPMRDAATGAGSYRGSGGMATKLDAAASLLDAHIPLVICNGRRERAILDAAGGKPIGTRFE